MDGAPEYLSRAVGTAPLPLAVQPLEQRFSFLHAVESHQCEQGVTGGLQGEQVVPAVGPVVNAWWTDGEQLAGTTFGTSSSKNTEHDWKKTLSATLDTDQSDHVLTSKASW